MTLLVVTFLAWVLTILAPCVLPILPIILAGSIGEKSWKRPLIITLSLAFSIVLFTLILKATTLLIDIPEVYWKYLSGAILVTLWIIYLFPHAWSMLGVKLGFGKSQELLSKTQNIHSGNLQAIATGFALGPVFSSCSPTYAFLLATVFPASLIQGIFYTFTYALGLASILFLIAWGGQAVIKKLKFFASETGWFKKTLGLIFVVIGLAIMSGYDKKAEIWILNQCNSSSLEQSLFDYFSPQTKLIEVPSNDTDSLLIEKNLPESDRATPIQKIDTPQTWTASLSILDTATGDLTEEQISEDLSEDLEDMVNDIFSIQ